MARLFCGAVDDQLAWRLVVGLQPEHARPHAGQVAAELVPRGVGERVEDLRQVLLLLMLLALLKWIQFVTTSSSRGFYAVMLLITLISIMMYLSQWL